MQDYVHPTKDVAFVLKHLIDMDSLCAATGFVDLGLDTALMIVNEAAKLGSEVLSPLNKTGDLQGAKLGDNGVEQTPGFAEAYQQYVDGGWGALGFTDEFGGQPVPKALSCAVNEIWQSANLSFALCPLLTQGAIEAIELHGAENLKANYLAKMISGEWTGTMNLTEPDAGSDLAALKTTAVPEGDHYLIHGQKIFITWGDHQMTDNIVHLVLARLPDAPPGVKGISLFVVPKFLLDEQGNPAERNDVQCIAVEHKLGIHGSPTCALSYGENRGAVGYLVGEAHNGLTYMFTMMNLARQTVGLQGLGVTEMAYQQCLTYAKERLQGTRSDGSRYPIIDFPDVRRMLMTIKATSEAMRGLAVIASAEGDKAEAADNETKTRHTLRYELYTPIVKGWMTEAAQEMVSLAVQIHGGMGFIEETGIAQHYRDARILPIYEGTTGIQAVDMVGRKTLLNGGAAVVALLEEIKATADQLVSHTTLSEQGKTLLQGVAAGQEALQLLAANAQQDKDFAGSVSVNYLMLFGWLCGGWVMGLSSLKANELLDQDERDFMETKLVTAQFYMEHLMPRVHQCLATMRAGSGSIMKLTSEQF